MLFFYTYSITSIPFFENQFGGINQILLPLFFGGIGCWIRLLVVIITPTKQDIKKEKKTEILKEYSWIFVLIGALAGFVSVNLINPQGTFAQVSTLSFLAGLSGITFLLRSSLVEGVLEENILSSVKENALSDIGDIKERLDSLDSEISPEELVNIIGEVYDISSIINLDAQNDDGSEEWVDEEDQDEVKSQENEERQETNRRSRRGRKSRVQRRSKIVRKLSERRNL
jgi:hypothetical protein